MSVVGYYPGCSLEGGGIELDLSVKALAAAAGVELREIEDADPQGHKHPRFKKSDDATAVLLKLVADIDPSTPVLFLNTGKLFGETLRYRADRPHLIRNTGATPARASMICILKAAAME